MASRFCQLVVDFLLNDFKGLAARHRLLPHNCGITPVEFAALMKLHQAGVFSRAEVRKIIAARLEELHP